MLMTRVTAWTAATITIATMTAGAQPARRPAQSSMRNERGFATELQRALRTGDRQTATSLVRYPARVSVLQRPHPIYVKDRDALEQMYDMVFTPTCVGRHILATTAATRSEVISTKARPANLTPSSTEFVRSAPVPVVAVVSRRSHINPGVEPGQASGPIRESAEPQASR